MARGNKGQDSIYAKVGIRLRELRMQGGLTQQDLAEKSQISIAFLSFLELGKRKGSLETYDRLARALGLGLDDLFRDPHRHGRAPKPAASPLAALSVAESRAVYRLVKTLRHKPKAS